MSQEIEASVDELLADTSITMEAFLVGETKRDAWVCDQWRIHFEINSITQGLKPSTTQSFDYYTGIGHRESKRKNPYKNVGSDKYYYREWETINLKPVKPVAASVLYSLVIDSSACDESFGDWCSNFGYDTDSRKASETYLACQENSEKLRKVFDRATIEKLKEILQDY